MKRKLGIVAAAVACVVALLPPALFYLFGHASQRAILVTEAEINARALTRIINANPELWHLETPRLETVLGQRARDRHNELRVIHDASGHVVAEVADALGRPVMSESAQLYDAGTPVASLTIGRSLQPLLIQTALVAALSILMAAAAYAVLKIYPIRAVEKALHSLLQERERAAAMEREKKAAEAATEAKAQFLANMSHEIRTPLNGVLGMTELLMGTDLQESQHRMAETAYRSAETLLSLINDILDFSKIEAGKLELDETTFEMRQLIEDLAAPFAPQAHAKGVELLCEMPHTLPECAVGDAVRLRQILTNLIGNAVKFTAHGEVNVSVSSQRESDDRVLFTFAVRDTGIGMDEDALQRLFQPFTQADSAMTRRFGGTGLGLSISKQLVALMHGEISVESTKGVGTTFFCTIPLRVETACPMHPVTPLTSLAGRRLLIVEDHATNRRILEEQLRPLGLQCDFAPNATVALGLMQAALAQGEPFDAAIVDMNLPGMSGLEFAKSVRASSSFSPIRLLMLTSVDPKGGERLAREAGIDAYITKPVRQGELHAQVARIFGLRPVVTPERPQKTTTARPARVLLAEDNALNRQVATTVLRKAGHAVEVAENGLEAVTQIKKGSFDMVLMDCQMPEMDGFAATAAIRELECRDAGRGHVPIIALTANALEGDRERCLAAKFDDYLAKPFKRQDLLAMVERWNAQSVAS